MAKLFPPKLHGHPKIGPLQSGGQRAEIADRESGRQGREKLYYPYD